MMVSMMRTDSVRRPRSSGIARLWRCLFPPASVTGRDALAPAAEGICKRRMFGPPRLPWAVLAVTCWVAMAGASAEPPPSEALDDVPLTLRERLETLLGNDMRLPGAPANLALEAYVLERFADSGFEYGHIAFSAPSFIPGDAAIVTDAGEYAIMPMHPSLFRPGNFPERAFTTGIVDLGRGSPGDLEAVRGTDLEGQIVLMDFHCGRRWERFLRFGVKGFLFVGAGHYETEDAYDKVPTSETAVPRYYISAADGQALRDAMDGSRRLTARFRVEPSRWENRKLRNPWVVIPGHDRDLGSDVVVFTAPLDANNVVPSLAAGAESGANVHLLLELLEEFTENPPARTVVLAAVNARTQNYLGDRALAWYLMAPESDIEQLRHELSADYRLQELYASYLERLEFRPETVEKDRKFLIELRGLTDISIGRQITIKDPVVALCQRDVNEIKLQRLYLHRESSRLQRRTNELARAMSDGAPPPDAPRELEDIRVRLDEIAREEHHLEQTMQKHVNVLTLFNRVGVQTELTDLTDVEEAILKGYIGEIVERNRVWASKNREDLERSERNIGIRRALEGRNVAVLISLELSWDSNAIGFSSGVPLGQSGWADRWGRNTTRIAEELTAGDHQRTNLLVDTLTGVGGLPEAFYIPNASQSLAFYKGAGRRPAFALNNAFATSVRAFKPDDTLENLNVQHVEEISGFARELFIAILADPTITGATELATPPVVLASSLWSTLVKAYKFDEFAAGVLPEIPVPGSAIILSSPQAPARGFTGPGIIAAYIVLSDERATGIFYGLRERLLSSSAFGFDDDFIKVTHAVDAGERHQQTSTDVRPGAVKILSLTAAHEFVIRERADSSRVAASPIYVRSYFPLSAERDSEPRSYGVSGAESGLSNKQMPSQAWGPAAFYIQPRERLKLMTDYKRLALNNSPEFPEGLGFLAGEKGADFFRHAMHDMDRLNRYRFEGFRGIADELVSDFLARGQAAAETAETAASEHDHVGYLRALYESLGAQVKAYNQIADTTNDMLKAVVFYMALLLPFCFFVQKLLFKSVRIEKQMIYFGILFVGCYVLFRFIHPAFQVARAPEAMFVAFIMGGLGLFVIYILHARFEGEMQLLFHAMTGHDDEDVGYSMVSQQAMLIGVSNMKRRRIRTVLTTATIVLVTFTMLAFTSVSRRMSPTIISQGRVAPYTGIMYHWPGGHRMDEESLSTLETMFAGDARIFTRRWLMPDSQAGQSTVFRAESETGETALIEGVLGVDPSEHGFLGPMPLVAGEFFSAMDAYETVISASLAEVLGVDPQRIGRQTIRFHNRDFRVVGIVGDERFRAIEDINGLPILPIRELLVPAGVSEDEVMADDDAMDETGVFHVGVASMLMLPLETSRRLGARPFSVSLQFDDDAEVWPAIDRLLTATSARFFVSSRVPFTIGEEGTRRNQPGIYYIGSGYRTSIGGLAMLIIPLLIASTIILNTMLGSVFERKKEIAVFNAVGLNPTHIGLFFLAESFVYGIIGSVGGYLIGQVSSIVLNRYGLVEDINLNFSSLSVAYVIVFTISIVMLSTLYPAAVATKAAVPSGQRKWSMPPHDGQVMDVVFPFIYQPKLVVGIMGYINDYFSQFSEASTGDLIAEPRGRDRTQDADGRPVYRLTYHVALAPFDLGVTQAVLFTAAFDERVDAYRVVMTITRESGQDSNWVTTNKPFLEQLRKLLLHWRNMKPAEHGAYSRMGTTLFAEETHG